MRSILSAALLACLCALGGSAHAADADPIEDAEARYVEGQQLHDAGQEDAARLKFEQAYSVLKAPRVLFSLARTEQLTAHPLQAIRHYRELLRDPQVPLDLKVKASQAVDALERETARLDIHATAGAVLVLDDDAARSVPQELIDVAPGKHRIDLAFGSTKQHVDVELANGETKRLDVVFEEPAAPVAATSPERAPPPPVGERTWNGTRIGLTAALATVGVTGIVIGVASSAAAVNADDRIQAANTKLGPVAACRGTPLPSACADLSSARSDHSSALVGSYLGYGFGVLGLGTAIASTLYWYTAPVRVVPAASSQSAGVFVMGSF